MSYLYEIIIFKQVKPHFWITKKGFLHLENLFLQGISLLFKFFIKKGPNLELILFLKLNIKDELNDIDENEYSIFEFKRDNKSEIKNFKYKKII